AIGENNEGFAAVLFLHQFVRRQENRVIEQRAPAAPAVRTTSTASASAAARGTARGATAATRGTTLRELRRINMLDRRLQFFAGRCQVLQQRNFTVELNDKSLVLVHQQSQRQGEIRFLGKISNRLGLAVLFQRKIILGQIADDVSLLIAHRGKQADRVHVQ